MPPRLTYSEHRPPPDLAPWVACFWRIRGAIDDGAAYFHRVAFTGIPADRVLDGGAPLAEWPVALRPSVAALSEQTETSVARLVSACRKRAADLDSPDSLVRHALGKWSRAEQGMPAVSVLARDIGLSERGLERRFIAQVGLTPVRYRRLARLRAVLRLHAGGMRDWAELAATTGFSDQPHLVRECRAFTGLTPSEWAASQESGVGFFQDGQLTTL